MIIIVNLKNGIQNKSSPIKWLKKRWRIALLNKVSAENWKSGLLKLTAEEI